ncbi:MAG TPA: hypothetical protein VFX48_07915, partial [Saprospiraceae bacterium]|nr:hypothetical protein [Saprospiraceae bacterium]
IFMVFSKNILKSRLSQFMQATEVELYLNEEQDYHIDGDYQGRLREWNVKVLPLALRVVL